MIVLRKWALKCHMLQTLVVATIQHAWCSEQDCGITAIDNVYSVAGAWTDQPKAYSNAACRQLPNRGRHQDCCKDDITLFSPECFHSDDSLKDFLQASRNRHIAFWGDSLTRQTYDSLVNSMAVQVRSGRRGMQCGHAHACRVVITDECMMTSSATDHYPLSALTSMQGIAYTGKVQAVALLPKAEYKLVADCSSGPNGGSMVGYWVQGARGTSPDARGTSPDAALAQKAAVAAA